MEGNASKYFQTDFLLKIGNSKAGDSSSNEDDDLAGVIGDLINETVESPRQNR